MIYIKKAKADPELNMVSDVKKNLFCKCFGNKRKSVVLLLNGAVSLGNTHMEKPKVLNAFFTLAFTN